MTARNFSNTAPPLQITANVSAGATSIPVPSTAGYPATPFTAALERGTANQEFLLVTSVIDATHFGVTRGYGSTPAVIHNSPATFEHCVGAIDYAEANTFINLMTTQGDLLTMGASAAQRLAAGSAGQIMGLAGSPLVPTWIAVPTKTLVIPHTYPISGPLGLPSAGLNYLPPFFLPTIPGAGSITVVGYRYMLRAGTSATIKTQKNGVDQTTGISATTTAASTTASIACASNDYWQPVITAISGSPDGLTFTFFVQYVF
jgi:hypothetical protein